MEVYDLVQSLNLQPHPEGGYYREIYRSRGVISENFLGLDFEGERNFATSIYFLLTSDNFSAFHRIKQDEIWHFYSGSPLHIHEITRDGNYIRHHLGLDLAHDQKPQIIIPAGSWFASSVDAEDGFTLVGCTVAPGFDFRDFELADREALLREYPQHKEVIGMYAR